ncbi:MAG: FG-GAP-like repeat-containing protein [Candidatus Latescibacterota bacterium]
MKPATLRASLAVVAVLVTVVTEAPAVTWDFDKAGNTQGWRAREGLLSGSSSSQLRVLPVRVHDGVLRVPVPAFEYFEDGRPRPPAVEVVSPRIGYSAALFDRLRVRLRLVHPAPLRGRAQLYWTNADNQAMPGRDWAHSLQQFVTYTTDWQDLLFAGLSLGPTQGGQDDHLTDLRLKLQLYEGTAGRPEETPEGVEIDWISLTGLQEQLQGELPPPSATPHQAFGELFAAPRFQPLDRRGIGSAYGDGHRKAALGDLDGDQDLDLCAVWQGQYAEGQGWLVAFNDGTGAFRTGRAEPLQLPFLDAADLNGDGLLDLMLAAGPTTYLLRNALQGDVSAAERIEGVWPLGLGDGDGDGQADLWVYSCSSAGDCQSLLYRNRGGVFPSAPTPLSAGAGKEAFVPFRLTTVPGRGAPTTTGVLWFRAGHGLVFTYLATPDSTGHVHLAADAEPSRIRYTGDCDLDGDLDLVVATREVFDNVSLKTGLRLLLNRGDGTFEALPWNAEARMHDFVHSADLNADGVPDLVLVDSDFRAPAVLVHLGARGGLPEQEGRYPLDGLGGIVLSGDVDGDQDVDLVVTERSGMESGGVYVLLNRLSERGTAVAGGWDGTPPAAATAHPSAPRLLPAYPNPFNPHTTLSVEVPGAAATVDLRIYDTLGRPVRSLLLGSLPSGTHAVVWDGRDDAGATVACGVYLCRLQAGRASQVQKVVRAQ